MQNAVPGFTNARFSMRVRDRPSPKAGGVFDVGPGLRALGASINHLSAAEGYCGMRASRYGRYQSDDHAAALLPSISRLGLVFFLRIAWELPTLSTIDLT